MDGIRLTGIEADVPGRHIEKVLSESGLKIKRIYYPLHNNNAVVLFDSFEDTSSALCKKLDHLNFKVHPLPHKVFSKVTVELQDIASTLLSAVENKKKVGEVTEGRLTISGGHDEPVTLTGDMFDIELAERVLSQEIEKQHKIYGQVMNGHDQAVADTIEQSKKENKRRNHKTVDITNKKSTAEKIKSSMRRGSGDSLRESPREQIDQQTVLNENDIPPGRGFQSISRMSSVDDHHSGRSSRDVDASDTFNHFASLKCYNTPALKDPTSKSLKIQDSEDVRAAAASGSLSQESRGAVGGREYTHSITEGERQHLLSRDEPISFTSTFAGEESMLRDLDNAPRDELAAIEKWVDDTRTAGSRPDTRVQEAGGFDHHETNPKSLDTEWNGQTEYDDQHTYRNMELDVKHKTRTSVKFSSYEEIASDVTDGSKYSFSLPGGIRVKVYHGNIITAKTEGIVNAANSELKNYAGVAGAIEKACGGIMRRECEKYIRQNGPLNISEVIHTSAGDLRGTLYILHTVGPVYIPSMDKQCGTYLTMTFLRCLDHARKKLHIHSLAFPFISTGVYGAPLEMCVEAFLDAVVLFSNSHKSDPGVTEIQLVNTDLEMVQTAIVMIRQHLDQGLDVLVDKAMSRLQEKRSLRDEDERFSRSVERGTKDTQVRRTSSLTRDRLPTASRQEDDRRWTQHRNDDTRSLQLEDTLYGGDDTETTGVKYTPHRQRSGSFDLPGSRSSAAEKTSSAGTKSGVGKRNTSSSKSDFSKTTPDFKTYGISKQAGTKDNYKPRPATTTGVNSPRSRPGPMKATNSTTSAGYQFSHADNHTTHIRHSVAAEHAERYSSLPSDLNQSRPLTKLSTSDPETCSICMDQLKNPYKLIKCGHTFCKGCITQAFETKPVCPVCGLLYGSVKGDQPDGGKMSHSIYTDISVPGFRDARGAIEIDYSFPSGIQQANHPNPGKRYAGISRQAYLPNNREGREVLRLLEKAFKAGVTFTIGESRTTGRQGVITWNDIHHKTSLTGGPTCFGYPDDTYLKRVKEELAAKGITG